jgi:hypothetical protein
MGIKVSASRMENNAQRSYFNLSPKQKMKKERLVVPAF